MTDTNTLSCPQCGHAGGGHFCEACGAALKSGFCTACGTALGPGARFCGQCGHCPGGVRSPGGRTGRPWLVPTVLLGGAVLVGFGVILARSSNAPTAPAAAPAAMAVAPDISQLSPRERFDRLYNRVMEAAEQGNAEEMARFTPMALAAYEMLDTRDADARYHAALLQLHAGGVAAAQALADSILSAAPDHLFGYLVRGSIAKWQRDQATVQRAYRDFNGVYDQEMARAQTDRPEYLEHSQAVAGFRAEATGSAPAE